MTQRLLIMLIVLLLGASIANAESFTGECSIRFFGDSTLHDFEGKAVCQPYTLPVEKDSKLIRKPVVSVPVDSMDTGIDSRNEDMRGMFAAEKFPTIEGLFADLAPEKVLLRMKPNGTVPGKLEFDLKIRDRRQQVQAEVHNLNVTAEIITFTLKFSLSLASFELDPPTVLGIIRVSDQVDVEVDAVLQRK